MTDDDQIRPWTMRAWWRVLCAFTDYLKIVARFAYYRWRFKTDHCDQCHRPFDFAIAHPSGRPFLFCEFHRNQFYRDAREMTICEK